MTNTSGPTKHPSVKEYLKMIGQRIKSIRKDQKLTQLDVAIKSGMEENAFQRIETGRINPTVKTLLKISLALEVEMLEFFIFKEFK